ncbi:MAG: hypothetical protein JRH08_09215 [Deltaproteobacteria bacterium]|nr:hypothetical protein [Deltaproteobacteria bacterium]MBW1928809.1 hypothetical protein [Deltaproteobacteria bacterium]MBW2026108.1 hypothetical protein [Deltaproteobacteria bacterium]MBW2125857.1 hypothetical protein [Deltaproteobacteria bacterium]RLB19371.1 MAG: hypothetical protein DRG63_01050 [Deltaproteobacteria bacterium]
MDLENKYRLRVKSCIGTIIDVHKIIGSKYNNEEFLAQFEELKQAVECLDMSMVSEGDVLMVEQATNALLKEFRALFSAGGLGPVYEKPKS